MEKHIFKGKWITNRSFATLEPINVFYRQLDKKRIPESSYKNCHVLFRKTFTVDVIKKTLIYISADDYYKLYINGNFVGQGPAPSYPSNYNYNIIDITNFLQEGKNIIAVHTYYQGLINRVWVSGDNQHGLILDVEQEGNIILSSDENFKCTLHSGYEISGIVGYDTQFTENYNANAEEVDFEKADYNDDYWDYACIKENMNHNLVPQKTKQMVTEKIIPSEIAVNSRKIFIDFGKNYVGTLFFKAIGNKNNTITVLYGQELNKDGSVRYEMRSNCNYKEEMVLSGQCDTFIQFDSKAFRYVELLLPQNSTVDQKSIHILATHYPFELTRATMISDEKIKVIWDLCVHTLKYGVQDTIQDCTDREKGFYLGDGCYTALTLGCLTDDWSMFKKLVEDSLQSSFITDSLMTCADCSFMQEIAEFPLIMLITLAIYLSITNDIDFLSEHYDELIKLLKTYEKNYLGKNGLLSNLDKWCVVEWPDNFRDNYDVNLCEGEICEDTHCVINAYYYAAAKSLNYISERLEKAEQFDSEKIKDSFLNAFYDSERQLFTDNVNSSHSSFISNMFSFAFGLCPDKNVEEKMITMLCKKGINSLNIFTTFPVLYKLKAEDLYDEIESHLKNEKAWLNMLSENATTTFETWGKDLKWNTSLFHLTLSYAAFFM